ncbi:MAG: rhodanese-like domain-containing protein [Gammaproteobacteria bacterium]|nr:rhodanese-like domain-containing protein [Gammaproteobacteria bacterium]
MTQQAMGLMDFVKAAKAAIKEVDGDGLQAMRGDRPNLLILDVRESSEHEQGYIEGAMLVPRGILEAAADYNYPKRVQTLVDARERPIVVYCATGGRSALAAVTLKQMGFGEVYSLAGGIAQWANENRPLLREATYV